LAFSGVYIIHLRRLLAALAVPVFVAAWWWTSFPGTRDALAPTEAVSGVRIVIDPGHGGVDPGAVGQGGALEKDVVMAIASKLAPMFQRVAIHTTMIRDGDVDLGGGVGTLRNQKRTDLARRVEIANQSGADIYLSLHANSFPSPRWSGAQTFYYPGKQDGEALAVAIQSELVKALPSNTRQARPGEYYVLERTSMPAVVIEVGFLSNPREEELLQDPGYQRVIAEAIFKGVVQFLLQEARGADADALAPIGGATNEPDVGRLWVSDAPRPGGAEFFLYFESAVPSSDGLSASIAAFPPQIVGAPLVDKMRYAMERLMQGPPESSALLPIAPTGTKVLALTLDDGTAYVDLSSEVDAPDWGGGRSERLLVEGVVRTLGQFPGVERVVIEVDGNSDGTLAGHVDISRPFEVRRSERP